MKAALLSRRKQFNDVRKLYSVFKGNSRWIFINRLFISGGVQFEKKLDEDSFDDSKTYSSDEERLTNQIKYCLENDMNAVKLFENWEFE